MLINSFVFGVAYDTDAQAYINAVEAADTAAGVSGGLEAATKDAINAFVVGCKADGIWTAIKASCILAGARTLAGALVPLVGAAPTRFGTEGGWTYDRKTGLKGSGSSSGANNYLKSGYFAASSTGNDNHFAVWKSSANTGGSNPYYGGYVSPVHLIPPSIIPLIESKVSKNPAQSCAVIIKLLYHYLRLNWLCYISSRNMETILYC
jgi:hypothetical protein